MGVKATIVESQSDPGLVSIRAWDEEKQRLGATALKRSLTAQFKPGDVVHIDRAPKALSEFEAWPSLKRFRKMYVTEKIDGTNAQIAIDVDGTVRAGSRNRWVTPESDNYGFAGWVKRHEEELRARLGTGRHFGEWYGAGIQRRYGLDHKRFALFNAFKWGFLNTDEYWAAKPGELRGLLTTVPVLFDGEFSTANVDDCLSNLKTAGSRAVPGFMDPEGVVVFDPQTGGRWKKTLDGDGHKGAK